MPFKTKSHSFDLTPTSIDEASEWLCENLAVLGFERRDSTRTRLLFEDALLNFSSKFGNEQTATAFLERKRRHYQLRLVVEGVRFNPTKGDDNQNELNISLFSVIDAHTQYSYTMGANVVRIPLPHKPMNPVLRIALAIAAGATLGALGDLLIPNDILESTANAILHPIADTWVRLLQAISGPVIFFTALSATMETKRISDFGGSRLNTIIRYFVLSALAVAFTMLCLSPLVFGAVDIIADSSKSAADLLSDILSLVPGNLFEPFHTANTPQLLIIAIVAGYALASMGAQGAELKLFVQQANLLGLTVARGMCGLVPYFVGLLLCLRIWSHSTDLLRLTWIPLALSVGISVAFSAIMVVSISIRLHTNPLVLLRKLRGPFLAAIRSGILDYSTVSDLVDSCKKLLGVDREFSLAVLPQGLVLYMPTSAIGICAFTLFTAHAQGMTLDYIWLLSATALAVVLAVATPPVNGANLLAFVVAFSYLGISSDTFLDVMVFDLIFGVFCIAFDQALLQLETVLQARKMGFLNEEALHTP